MSPRTEQWIKEKAAYHAAAAMDPNATGHARRTSTALADAYSELLHGEVEVSEEQYPSAIGVSLPGIRRRTPDHSASWLPL